MINQISNIPGLNNTMTKFSNTSLGQLEHMANLLTHLRTKDSFRDFSLPRGWNRGNLTSALLLIRLTRGLGIGVGLAGSSPGFRSCYRAGGVGDRGTTLTLDTILTRPKLSALGNLTIN